MVVNVNSYILIFCFQVNFIAFNKLPYIYHLLYINAKGGRRTELGS